MRRRSTMMTTDLYQLSQLSQPNLRRGMCRRRIGRVHPRFRKHVLPPARRRRPRSDPRITRTESRRGERRTEVAAVWLNLKLAYLLREPYEFARETVSYLLNLLCKTSLNICACVLACYVTNFIICGFVDVCLLCDTYASCL